MRHCSPGGRRASALARAAAADHARLAEAREDLVRCRLGIAVGRQVVLSLPEVAGRTAPARYTAPSCATKYVQVRVV